MSGKLSFQPFDENGEGRVYYHGFLPHWRQEGCTYFVTFRLADSIPQKVLNQWNYEKRKWLEKRVANPGTESNPVKQLSKGDRFQFYRAFSSKLFNELDRSSGSCVLRSVEFSKIVFDAILYFHGTRVSCGDFVVMPNHVHALLTPQGKFELEDVLHSIKSFTAHKIQVKRRSSGVFWMKESHDHIVRDVEELVRIQRYIRSNPERANLAMGEFRLHTAEYHLD